jgi:hypothetical protein
VLQFIDGPAALLTPSGEALTANTFNIVSDCADELGIPHSRPHN